jgi:hypothetical protein
MKRDIEREFYIDELAELWPQLTRWQQIEMIWRVRWMVFKHEHPRLAAALLKSPAVVLPLVLASQILWAVLR